MTRLSVNINKIALIRNSRGGNRPDVLKCALDIESFGADGITVHPRPDERHIRYSDVCTLKKNIATELNVEGNPLEDKFVQLVMDVVPAQVTLVPDARNALTSSAGWDTVRYKKELQEWANLFHTKGIRVSIFVNPDERMAAAASECGCDRIELYTEDYAKQYNHNRESAIAEYMKAAQAAKNSGLGINAGHDLDLINLNYLIQSIPYIDEVSIGHALISDALYYGLSNTIRMYKRQLDYRP